MVRTYVVPWYVRTYVPSYHHRVAIPFGSACTYDAQYQWYQWYTYPMVRTRVRTAPWYVHVYLVPVVWWYKYRFHYLNQKMTPTTGRTYRYVRTCTYGAATKISGDVFTTMTYTYTAFRRNHQTLVVPWYGPYHGTSSRLNVWLVGTQR